jgi:hypothetical protein
MRCGSGRGVNPTAYGSSEVTCVRGARRGGGPSCGIAISAVKHQLSRLCQAGRGHAHGTHQVIRGMVPLRELLILYRRHVTGAAARTSW